MARGKNLRCSIVFKISEYEKESSRFPKKKSSEMYGKGREIKRISRFTPGLCVL